MIASDGYEYETLADRLLGRPKECTRNGNLRHYAQTYGQEVFRAYQKGFDEVCPEGDPGPSEKFAKAHSKGIDAAYATGKFEGRQAAKRELAKHFADLTDRIIFDHLTRRPSGNGQPASLSAAPAPVHPAN